MPSLQALVLVLQGDLQSLLAELNCCMLLEWHRRPPLPVCMYVCMIT